jgi:hypothetical protein
MKDTKQLVHHCTKSEKNLFQRSLKRVEVRGGLEFFFLKLFLFKNIFK